METVTSLQNIINNKAENRLDADIEIISSAIRSNSLLSITNNPGIPDISMKLENGQEKTQKPYWFFQSNSNFFDEVKKYWLPTYIRKEAEMFVTRIDELKTEVDTLLDNKNYE